MRFRFRAALGKKRSASELPQLPELASFPHGRYLVGRHGASTVIARQVQASTALFGWSWKAPRRPLSQHCGSLFPVSSAPGSHSTFQPPRCHVSLMAVTLAAPVQIPPPPVAFALLCSSSFSANPAIRDPSSQPSIVYRKIP